MKPQTADLTSFYERAAHLGHDKPVLDSSGKQITTRTIYSLREMRDLVTLLDPARRAARQTAMVQSRAGRPEALHDRIEAYLHGTGELTEKEHADSHSGFPVTLKLVSYVDRTLPPGETLIGPSASPTIENYGTLKIPNGSWITVRNTYYTLNVTNLIMQAT
jgi:hypothetical protein